MVNIFDDYAKNKVVQTYPNPFRESVVFDFGDQSFEKLTFELYDITGKQLRREKHAGSQFTVQRGNLTQGMYFYHILQNGHLLANGKVIID